MTEKELLYMEDAIEHEKAIIEICNDIINKLSDNNLILFMNEQVEYHLDMKEKLISTLKEIANDK